MKLKLDENLSHSFRQILEESGHDACSVYDQGLSGADDDAVFERCQADGRILITLDLGFSDIIRFPVRESPGVVIARCREPHSWDKLDRLARDLAIFLENRSPARALWIVESGRLRVRGDARV